MANKNRKISKHTRDNSYWYLLPIVLLVLWIGVLFFPNKETTESEGTETTSPNVYELINTDSGYFDLYDAKSSKATSMGCLFVEVTYKCQDKEKTQKFFFINTEFVADDSNYVEINWINDGSVFGKNTCIIHTTEDISYIAPLKEKMSKHVY